MILGLTLFVCGFICTYDFLKEKKPALGDIQELVNRIIKPVAYIALFIGVWKFFGPDDFSHNLNAMAFIGDLIPALILINCALSTHPEILNILNISPSKKEFIKDYLGKSRLFAGFSAFIAGFIHIIAGGNPLI